jgi:hypothetical protein
MSKAYADALKYFRTNLKAGPEPQAEKSSADVPPVSTSNESSNDPEMGGKKAADPLTDGGVKQTSEDSGNPTPATAMELPEPWPWGHLMSREEFLKRDPWRQQQLIAQWEENVALGGVWTPVLRGKPRRGPCFGNCAMGNCTCNDPMEIF